MPKVCTKVYILQSGIVQDHFIYNKGEVSLFGHCVDFVLFGRSLCRFRRLGFETRVTRYFQSSHEFVPSTPISYCDL